MNNELLRGKAVHTKYGIFKKDYKGRYNLNGEWYGNNFPSILKGERYWYYSKSYHSIVTFYFD